MRTVLAQGTFDILHPGHVHYLAQSCRLGSRLHVVIARDSRVRERKPLFMDEESRRRVVEALEPVDRAHLGDEDDIFESVERIDPDVVTVGYDQDIDVDELTTRLGEEGHADVEVTRIGPYRGPGETASSNVKAAVKSRLGTTVFQSTEG